MPARIFFPPVLLVFLALPAPLPAWAQSQEEAICRNANNRLPPAEVIPACDRLVADARQRDSARARALAWRGIAHLRANDRAAALNDFNQAIALDEDNVDALYSRAQLRAAAREHQNALADLDRALKLNPDAVAPHMLRSNVYLELRRYPEAIADADFERGGGAAVLNQRCWTRAVAGIELDKARIACDQGLWAQPDALPILDSRGVVGLKQKHFQAAWNDFNQVMRGAPRNARALYGRGLAAIGLGREAEGKADIAGAEALNRNVAALYADIGIPAP